MIFDGELYSVRDNGAIFRHSRKGKRIHPNDDKWTFGIENKNNPYLHISNVRVHRIVATAFHGDPPDPKYVVDHIDTNCRNNRSENLRWLTRLESSLKNPFTRKKIEYLCGSIEAFLENPSMLNELHVNPNYAWMKTVPLEEAKNCRERMSLWLNKPSQKGTSRNTLRGRSHLEKSIYKPLKKWEVFGREPGLDLSSTPRCGQYMWNAILYFPQCPEESEAEPLLEYYENLKENHILAYSDSSELCPELTLLDKTYFEEKPAILALSKSDKTRFTIVGIKLDEKTGYFIHFHLGTFLNENEAIESLSLLKCKNDWWGASLSISYANRY